MALKPCRECGAQVSTSAEVCPHCGVRSPAAENPVTVVGQPASKGWGVEGCLGALLLVGLLGVAIAIVSNNADQKPDEHAACRGDWHKCKDNADLVNNSGEWSRVEVDCKIAAEKSARYGSPKWPWFAFGSFFKGSNYVQTGRVVAVEPDAQFQNGFGAYVHSRVTCDYDLTLKNVTNVYVTPR